jgi:hypothetical protein
MYADDVVIFLNPTNSDVTNLKDLLLNFGAVTGLQTNLQKTSVTTIRGNSIDIDSVLADLPATHFPLKYIGLPLSQNRLCKLDFPPLIDKAAGKLSMWNERNITQAGRVSLTKSVLSSQPVYTLTVLEPSKESLEEIDKLRQRFL